MNEILSRIKKHYTKYNLIFILTVQVLSFCIVFLFCETILHVKHQVSVFVAFLLLPMIYLSIRENPEKILKSLGGINKGYLEGLTIYGIFTIYLFLYFLRDPDFFDKYDKTGSVLLSSLFFTALNVMPVDFFTKRFVQRPLSQKYGPKIGISLQTIVWLLAHYPESLWLDELMGSIGVWIFLAFTGIVTSISYERTRNVSGQMTGHVMINAFASTFGKL